MYYNNTAVAYWRHRTKHSPDGMIIINADDWGGWRSATDAALTCYSEQRITSVTAMVFMDDSERAAALAHEAGITVGLHINFNQAFTGRNCAPQLATTHNRIRRFLRANRYAQLIYNPWLCSAFRFVYEAQLNEFRRLYQCEPSHFDGHQHMHLCANALWDGLIPRGRKVRRNFSFMPGEKCVLNRAYRRCVDYCLEQRYTVTDYFFSLSQNLEAPGLERVERLGKVATVELMTHPEIREEFRMLCSKQFWKLLEQVKTGSYAAMDGPDKRCVK